MMLELEFVGGLLAQGILTLAEDTNLVRRKEKPAFGLAMLDAAQIIVDEMVGGDAAFGNS